MDSCTLRPGRVWDPPLPRPAPFAIRFSLFAAFDHSPFAIRHSPFFSARQSPFFPFTIRYSLFAVFDHSPFAVAGVQSVRAQWDRNKEVSL
jgi:hypothetical protein